MRSNAHQSSRAGVRPDAHRDTGVPWVLTFVPVATVTPCEEPTFTVALPPTAVAPPPAPPTDVPTLTPVLGGVAGVAAVAAGRRGVTCGHRHLHPRRGSRGGGGHVHRGVATDGRGAAAVAAGRAAGMHRRADAHAGAGGVVRPLPPLAEALPAVADTCTPARRAGRTRRGRGRRTRLRRRRVTAGRVARSHPHHPSPHHYSTDTAGRRSRRRCRGSLPRRRGRRGARRRAGPSAHRGRTDRDRDARRLGHAAAHRHRHRREVDALGDPPAANAAPGNAKPAASTPNAPVSVISSSVRIPQSAGRQ